MIFILIFFTSLLVVVFAIPSIIRVAVRKRLFDEPKESRKVHSKVIPNLGGIAIFTGFLFSGCLFIDSALFPNANILMAGGLILFMVGLKDDLTGLSPGIKFLAQFVSALIICIAADLRFDNLHGFLGFGQLSFPVAVIVTTIFLVGITNAYNLIDGIDGLAGSLGVIISLVYAFLFYEAGELGWAGLSIGLAGALIGFLFYNVSPAHIFMGDSGSLLLGFLAGVLSVKLATMADRNMSIATQDLTAVLGLILSILIIPIFDTIRVFTLRILKNKSPFEADNNHLHHRLLFLGLSHPQSTLILCVVNCLFIIMAFALQHLGNTILIGLLTLTALVVNGVFSIFIERYKRSRLMDTYVKEASVDSKLFSEEIIEKISEN